MKIEGIEYLPNSIVKEVIEFVLRNFLDNEEITISEIDDNIYLINDIPSTWCLLGTRYWV